MKNIYLIGFMGTGKSTVGKVLAQRLGTDCAEMDEWIEKQQKMPITEIFDRYGEKHFRDLETDLLRSFIAKEKMVVSCGGGCVLREENTAMMRQSGVIVLLTASPETIYERVKNSTNRPVLNGNMNVDYIRDRMEERRACYEGASDICIATDGKTAEQICEEILKKIS